MTVTRKFSQEHINARELMLSTAVAAGKFGDARRQFWAQRYDADPGGTARVIACLAPGSPPPAASTRAQAAGIGPYNDRLLSGPERARIAAAKAGRPHGVITTEI